jgi:hypothetical protein
MEQRNLFWPCVEIRGGANRKHATENESKDKRGNDRQQRHGQHARPPSECSYLVPFRCTKARDGATVFFLPDRFGGAARAAGIASEE